MLAFIKEGLHSAITLVQMALSLPIGERATLTSFYIIKNNYGEK